MRTVVVRGGWQAWALLILGGAVVLVLGLTVGIVLLGLLAVGAVVLLGQRALQALGIGGWRKPVGSSTTTPADGIIDGDFQVVRRESSTRMLAEPERRDAIARAGHARTKSEHTYGMRFPPLVAAALEAARRT